MCALILLYSYCEGFQWSEICGGMQKTGGWVPMTTADCRINALVFENHNCYYTYLHVN